MTPDWVFQAMWFSAGVGGTGAVWYFLSERNYYALLWTVFGTVVIVLFTVALHIRNDLLLRDRQAATATGPTTASTPVALSAPSSAISVGGRGVGSPAEATGTVRSASGWRMETPLNGPRVWHSVTAFSRSLYVIGGFNRPSGPGSDVRFKSTEWTSVESDGTLGLWQAASPMTRIRIGGSSIVVDDGIYMLGGETGEIGQSCDKPESCFTATIERSRIRPDGGLGPWELIGSMPSERWGFATVVLGRHLYVIGGNDGKAPLANVQRARLNGDGVPGSWTPMSSLGAPRWAVAAISAAGFIYVFGGQDGVNTLRTVERARVAADGSLGQWEIAGTMLERRHGAAVVARADRIYVIGGYSGAGPGDTAPNEYLTSVEAATVKQDGTFGPWERRGAMKSSRGYHSAAIVGNFIYAIGGGSSKGFLPTVERLEIQ